MDFLKMKKITDKEKREVHNFLSDVASGKVKPPALKDLDCPKYSKEGSKEMVLISEKIMKNDYFKDYFENELNKTIIVNENPQQKTATTEEGERVNLISVQEALTEILESVRELKKEGLF